MCVYVSRKVKENQTSKINQLLSNFTEKRTTNQANL